MSVQPAARASASKVWEENAVPRHRIQWCPGCGDYGVLNALKLAFTRLELVPHEVLLIGGIGCSGQIRNYLNGNGFHGTHGGPLAYALGVKMANPDLRVVALAGDGDTFAIGVENFVHACRRDPQVTLIVMDNGVYGLTTGQRSPTGGLGQDFPEFSEEEPPPFSPLRLALAAGATFIAQSFSGDPKHAAEVYAQAMEHPGFAFVNDFSPCVTYNKFNTYDWFRERLQPVPADHDPTSLEAAWELLADFRRRGRSPLGVVYRNPRRRKAQRRVPMWPQELEGIDLEPMLRAFR
ncbi:MAG: thiamine pyrophosphate-dependent enzyme [Armatimonadota bacterium]|nr:thiamine pyrophosphate-dependent enzyme [Armatimonadota bacterium]MDR7427510.1 thiamine pyrophosphate-dependent enzyme [Armatimonadota bacterium]MDR7463622.1 thiamine pyrophosphate-dependent enzyme [Armatimonadota bacterium]MDR7469843.1 thiamine pyrophosphate-dependent enzyme [Armatimonadota bacterium]MDR7475196.1 thiamine pyrophosphate-dependent enzyme [Armatimonadota bacterium]